MKAYPIKFEPILQEKIWGGSKLRTVLNKKAISDSTGESWEISGVQDNISVVSNGMYKGLSIVDLIENHKEQFVGMKNYRHFGNEFPLLIKYLDARTNLSVQVHPDDQMAKAEHDSKGKTEMWYIMDHEEDACVINGFKDDKVTTSSLKEITINNVEEILNTEKVSKGDSFFIPAGKVHAIGAGVLAAEIQQTSDITYRVYDWDRVDNFGKERELHMDQSMRAVKRSNTTLSNNIEFESDTNVLADCTYFTSTILDVDRAMQMDYTNKDSFVIYMCVEGSFEITINNHTEMISVGETVLIPANSTNVTVDTEAAKIIEVYIK